MLVNKKGGNSVEITNTSSNPVNTTSTDGSALDLIGHNLVFGRIPNFASNFIAMDNSIVGTTEQTILQGGVVASNQVSLPASLRTMSIASSSANDTIAGTGAQKVFIFGLDAEYNSVASLVEMNGQTEVDTGVQFFRVSDCLIQQSGSSNKNEGIIYVSDDTDTFTSGVPQNRIYDLIDVGHGLSKSGVYTVPNGKRVAFKIAGINSDATSSKPLTIRVYRQDVNFSNNTEVLISTFYVAESRFNSYAYIRAFDAGDEIRVTAQTGTGTVSLALYLHIALQDVDDTF